MEKHNFKKKYGQNFLRNDAILDRIVSSFECDNNSKIIEVGPGDGALTKKLVKKNVDVVAFEIDETLKQYLDKIDVSNLSVIYCDFLEVKLEDYFSNKDRLCVIANIPYYITTPIITKFIDDKFIPEVMVLMVQKEVAERLSAKPKTSSYGAITVLLNYYFDIQYLFTVDRSEFYPVPNVDSAIIKLVKKNNNVECDYNKFKKIVNDAFKQKRKNLRNNLKNYDLNIIEEILNKYNFNLCSRAEELSLDVFIEICNNL